MNILRRGRSVLLKENLATQLAWKIGMIYRLHMQNVSGIIENYDLYPGQLRIMHTIAEMNGSTQKEIAAKLNVTPASLAVSIKRLQKAGIVDKAADKVDLRHNRIFITEKGSKVQSDSMSELIRIDNFLLSGFSPEETNHFEAYLTRVYTNLKEVNDLNGK